MNHSTPQQGASQSAPQPDPVPQPAPTAPRSGAGKAIVIAASIIGGLALLGAATTTIVSAAVMSGSGGGSTGAVAVDGVTALDADVSAGDLRVIFADVDEATLDVAASRGEWTLERNANTLVVSSPWVPFGWNLWCFGWCSEDRGEATLTLPEDLQQSGLDASLQLSAGSLEADGTFQNLTLELSAGSMMVTGEARTASVDMSAGRLTTDLRDVDTADFTVAAGSADAKLQGSAPSDVSVELSAGSMALTLPDEEYRVTTEVAAGSVDNRLSTSDTARHTVSVEVAAGSVKLIPGR